MPLRKPTDATEAVLTAIQEAIRLRDDAPATQAADAAPLPREAYHYEAELKVEVVKRIQQKADETLKQEEWVVIDGVDKR